MRKLPITHAVFLSAVGFTTHTQAYLTSELSESLYGGKQITLKNVSKGKWVAVPATGNPEQTTIPNDNTVWILLKAGAPTGVTHTDGLTPIYISNVGIKKYTLHRNINTNSTPVMSEGEAEASDDGIWYVTTEDNIVLIPVNIPTNEASLWTFANNPLLDYRGGATLSKWNSGGNDTGNRCGAAEYVEPDITVGKILSIAYPT